MLLSLLDRLVRCLLGLLVVLIRSDLSKDVELLVLCHKNQVLHRWAVGRGGIRSTGSDSRRCYGW